MKTKHVRAGLIFALNYHGIDAKLSIDDATLADELLDEVVHGIECSKMGADPAITARAGLRAGAQSAPSLRKENAQLRVALQSENERLRADLKKVQTQLDEALRVVAEVRPIEIKIGATVRLIADAKSTIGTPIGRQHDLKVGNIHRDEFFVQLPGHAAIGWWVARDQIAEVVK